MKSLVWLRNDLRLDDNPSFKELLSNSKFVMPYIYSPENQLKIHNESNIKIILQLKCLKSFRKIISLNH